MIGVFILKMFKKEKKNPSKIVNNKYSDFHGSSENKEKNYRTITFNDKEQPTKNSNCITTVRYGILSFIPFFFFEKLKQYPIQYFIFISILQQIPDASPLGRFTTIIPLGIIIFVSAIKSIIDDIIKHKSDREINHRHVKVLRNGILIQEKWSDIGVGDIVRVENSSIIPADLILLSSSELHGTCCIETTHLDNEIDLKIKQSPRELLYCNEFKDYINFDGIIECELPNKLLYSFLGRLTIANNNSSIPLNNEQFLLRGSVLRNTKWIYGVVIYAGHETKLILHQSTDSNKETTLDRILNSQIKTIFIFIFLLSILCATCCTWWTKKNLKKHWYLQLQDVDEYTFFVQVVTFFILFHNTIPIPLQVYIQIIRSIQAWFINNDIEMYCEESNTSAMVRSPNLNDELGKVKYIFSNKTGTLTNNFMKLKHCSIAGELYLDGSQNKIKNDLANHSMKNYISEFLRIMSVCHTVIPENLYRTNSTVYNCSSPEEHALVIGSQQFGYKFHSRSPKSVTVTANDVEEHFEILNIIEFTSARKRMSVIVRTPESKIKLYCKGADTAIFKCLSKSGQMYKDQTMVHLNYFDHAGYRTLCFAYANISESFYEIWNEEYLKASTVLENREVAKNKVAEKIEKNLKLIGVTAIENKIQDNVPKTIQALMSAEIKIWLLTGNKQETAINIGLSTNLITRDSKIIILDQSKLMDLGQSIHKHLHDMGLTIQKSSWTLVINERSLKCLLSKELREDFLKLCTSCKSVICCVLSPTQKAEIVDFVTKYTNEITLAVGGGTNDVPMIHKASIGVGISGFKGLQAANASDYSIAQFQYLSKLLFVHGAWNYEKISKMIYFYYYKNICFYTLQLWFTLYSGWSGQVLFNKWIICSYNFLFTAALPLAMGLFLTTRNAETRLKYPKMYTQTKYIFNNKMFFIWIINAVFHSILLFWTCLFIMKHEVIWSKGRVGDNSVLGNIIYTCMLVVVCLKAGLHIQSWSYIIHITTWASILSWFLFILFYDKLKTFLLTFAISMNLNDIILHSVIFWTTIVLTTSAVLVFDLTAIVIKRTFYKNGAKCETKIY